MTLLLNWIWQGALLTAAVAAAMACTWRLNAATRERIWWFAMFAVLLLPLAALVDPPGGDVLSSVPAPIVTTGNVAARSGSLWWLIASGAGAGLVAFRLVQLGASVYRLRRMRARAMPLPMEIERQLSRWTQIREVDREAARTRLTISGAIEHAAALGLGPPLIAIAPDTLTRLTRDELDQVVIHEFAHVRRGDPAGILVQRMIWCLAGWHPAVWWIDRALTLEREAACDDWVLAHATGARAYGACLVKLSAKGGAATWSPAPGAFLSRSLLGIRVRRLLDPLRNGSLSRSRRALAAASVAMAVATPLGAQLRLVEPIRLTSLVQSVRPAAVTPVTPVPLPRPLEPSTGISDGGIGRMAAVTPRPAATRSPARAALADTFTPQPPDGRFVVADTVAVPVARLALEQVGEISTPLRTTPGGGTPATTAAAQGGEGRSAWMRLADAGIAVGDGVRNAGVRTGSVFGRLGRSIGNSF